MKQKEPAKFTTMRNLFVPYFSLDLAKSILQSQDKQTKEPKLIVIDGLIGAAKSTFIRLFIDHLCSLGKKVVIIEEPVDLWIKSGIFQAFNQDRKRWGYTFQTTAFHSRIMTSIKAYHEHAHDTDYFITERCVFSDSIFMKMLLEDKRNAGKKILEEVGDMNEHILNSSDPEYRENLYGDELRQKEKLGLQLIEEANMEEVEYHNWFNLWYMLMPAVPNIFIWLQCDVDICMDRIKKRDRIGEKSITKEYLTRLLEGYTSIMGSNKVIVDNIEIPCCRLSTNEEFEDVPNKQQEMFAEVHKMLDLMVKL